ncbi:hypothetical protein GCM10017673_16810 [Streptosporangium violaceochromogenes]|nr:hypothetical protein GCM10017673_16810 [Streptosporangium violaceochromogenes]
MSAVKNADLTPTARVVLGFPPPRAQAGHEIPGAVDRSAEDTGGSGRGGEGGE